MDKRLILIGLVVFATTAFAQPRARLLQLENYLQEQGLKKINTYKSNAKTAKIKHYWSGQLTAHTPKAVIDSIRMSTTLGCVCTNGWSGTGRVNGCNVSVS